MKKLIILLYFFISFQSAYCQDALNQDIRQGVDAILKKIEVETDENKRFTLILSSYNFIVDSNPLLILETSQKLYNISQRNKDNVSDASAWSFYGQGFRLSGNYVKGLECQHKAITLGACRTL